MKNTENTEDSTTPSKNITFSIPNPKIYLNKAKNAAKSLSDHENSQNYSENQENPSKFHKFISKTKPITLFLTIFLIINLIIAYKNHDLISQNKKLLSDNVTMYEMFDVVNVTRISSSREIKYLESLLEDNNIHFNDFYGYYIQEQVNEEYKETIEKFHKVDYNTVLDQFLNEDYNTMLFEMRMQELEDRRKMGIE